MHATMRPTVYVTRALPAPGEDLLPERCDVVVHPGEGPPSREELLKNIAYKDGLLCLVSERIDRELMDAAPREANRGCP